VEERIMKKPSNFPLGIVTGMSHDLRHSQLRSANRRTLRSARGKVRGYDESYALLG
jgi:hypothetical protein